MVKPLLTMLALWMLALTAAAAPLPDYLRYAEDAGSARLEVAIKTFTLPSGQTVDLVGVVHIADGVYYQDVNRRLAGYDAVLFELVGDATRLTAAAPGTAGAGSGSTVSFLQQAASRNLNLQFQLNAIDYTRKNMVHADMSAEEFSSSQAARGEDMLTMFIRAMHAQARGEMGDGNELNTFDLIRILMSPDSAAEFKKALAKNFDQMESMTAAMEGKEGSTILRGRNEVALKKLREVLNNPRQRRVAVFYGAAHMPGIEAAMLAEMKATAGGEEWLTAWNMPKSRPSAPPSVKP